MAYLFVQHPVGLNMDSIRLKEADFASAEVSSAGLTFEIDGPEGNLLSLAFLGTGIDLNEAEEGVVGTVTALSWNQTIETGRLSFAISGQETPFALIFDFLKDNDVPGALAVMLSGNDYIDGGMTGGLLRGFAGADQMTGTGSMFGGLGNDTITGGTSAYIRGDEGDDQLSGTDGFQDINGNVGADTCVGGGGNDWVVGGKDNDLLYGDLSFAEAPFGNDLVYGNLGDDTCVGGGGADTVRGGQGNDSLQGGAGADYLSGDRGDDTMSGGTGADTFHSFSGAGIDRVLDFKRAENDIVRLDQGSTYSVSQAGADTYIDIIGGGRVILVGVSMASLTGDWIIVG